MVAVIPGMPARPCKIVTNRKTKEMKNAVSACLLTLLIATVGWAEDRDILFDGKHLDAWDFAAGSWVIDDDESMVCRLETVTAKDGSQRQKSMGYIWTKASYQDFELSLSYKLSEGCNSGVFFRTDKDNPVQGGFEVQLLDNEGFQRTHGKKDAKNLNGALYDAKAATTDPAKPAGQWNQLTLRCIGPKIQISINGILVNDLVIDHWDTPQANPDGSANKFKVALRDLPRVGRIGFQNHGQLAWFKDVTIRTSVAAANETSN